MAQPSIDDIRSKDFELLREVSKFFDENVLCEVVAKDKGLSNPKNIQIISCDFGEASAKGESNLSIVSRVLVTARSLEQDGKILSSPLIIKYLPSSPGRRKTFRSTEFFRNEIAFYSEVVPRFHKFLESKNEKKLLQIPVCLAYHLDGENDFIVLQDVTQFGFHPIVRQNVFSYDRCKCIFETLARFHSISFAYKHEHPDEFSHLSSAIEETFYTSQNYDTWYREFFEETLWRVARDALAREYPDSLAEKKFNAHTPRQLFDRCIELCNRKSSPSSVISQGDVWAPNFLFREKSPGEFEAIMLDFQLTRCCSPVVDLSFFIYVCSDKAFRDLFYDQILKEYYAELNRTSKILGLDLDTVYNWETFLKEVKEQSIFGLTFNLEALPVSMRPEEEAFENDSVGGMEKINIAKIWTIPNIENAKNRRRHADMIVHAVEQGFL